MLVSLENSKINRFNITSVPFLLCGHVYFPHSLLYLFDEFVRVLKCIINVQLHFGLVINLTSSYEERNCKKETKLKAPATKPSLFNVCFLI